jgi:phage shock protein A
LDRVENPEAMIGQIIREMEDSLALARSYAAGAIAAERRLGRELAQERAVIDEWQAKARTALASNREDLARLALARKKEHATLAAELAKQHTAALETSMQVRASLQALESDFGAACRKQRSLIARHRAAQARQQLCQAAGMRRARGFAAGAELRRWDERLTQLEDEVAARLELQEQTGVETSFASWESEIELERELALLKEQMKDS